MKVIKRKLGREKAYGLAHSDGIIEIDERLKGRKLLEILIHEALHILNPTHEEDEVVKQSKALTKLLWKEGYRLTDNELGQPLQNKL